MKLDSLSENMSESNRIGVELMITDSKTALTLLDLAATTAVPEDRTRRIGEAHVAYRTIVSYRQRLSATPEQDKQLGELLKVLEGRLEEAGVKVK
jgi:hypothetical protein